MSTYDPWLEYLEGAIRELDTARQDPAIAEARLDEITNDLKKRKIKHTKQRRVLKRKALKVWRRGERVKLCERWVLEARIIVKEKEYERAFEAGPWC